MEAEKFLKEWKRMCQSQGKCITCKAALVCPYIPGIFPHKQTNPAAIVPAVERWAAEHPQKTRLSDFLEKYPNAPKREDGTPIVCAAAIGYGSFCSVGIYHKTCRDCWNQPLE